jgi:hypothetical protein
MLMYDPDGVGRYSVHHNLFAHVSKRAPAVNQGPAEVINNLVYNAQLAYHHDNAAGGTFNLIANRMKAGPDNATRDPSPLYFDNDGNGQMTSAAGGAFVSQLYVDAPGFFVGLNDAPRAFPSVADAQDTNADASWYKTSAYDFCGNTNYVPVRTDDVGPNEALVLARAGAFPRDAVTTRMISEYNARTGGWGYQTNERLNATSLMTGLTAAVAPADTDDDGMADSWESTHGLTVGVDDHNFTQPSGYTAIEDYLNDLADALVPARSSTLCDGSVIGPTGTTGLSGASGPSAASGTAPPAAGDEPAPSANPMPGGNETYPQKPGCACGSAGDASTWIVALLLTLLRLRWHARARHEVH